MRLRLTALLLAAAVPALGAAAGAVRRGDLVLHVKATGTVVPDDVFRLKSTIEGRVESVNVSSDSWRGADQPLALLAFKELAAIIDARGTQSLDVVEDRWSRVYHPTPVRCPDACYVLKVYVKAHAWVKPQAVLFEAASKLKLVGRVRPEDAPLIREGMALTFWAVKNPARKLTARIERVVFDRRDEKADPGATVSLDLTPDRSLDPGTQWEGEIIPLRKAAVLLVPTASLIVQDGSVYLPVRVSTGVTAADYTQITAGVEEGRGILLLDDASLHGAARHAPVIDRAALELYRREQEAAAAPDQPPAPAAGAGDKAPAERQPATLDDKNYGGEDPYGEQ